MIDGSHYPTSAMYTVRQHLSQRCQLWFTSLCIFINSPDGEELMMNREPTTIQLTSLQSCLQAYTLLHAHRHPYRKPLHSFTLFRSCDYSMSSDCHLLDNTPSTVGNVGFKLSNSALNCFRISVTLPCSVIRPPAFCSNYYISTLFSISILRKHTRCGSVI